jgi:hypothetical protein
VLLDTSAEVMTMAVAVAPSSGTGIGNGDDEETEEVAPEENAAANDETATTGQVPESSSPEYA